MELQKQMNFISLGMQVFYFLIVMLWFLSLYLLWVSKNKITTSIENQSRYFLLYTLISGLLIIVWDGKNLGIPDSYLSNITTELIGIVVTVVLIDRVYSYISSKNEQLYRNLSLKSCRMPIYSYCSNWFYIFEPNKEVRNGLISEFTTLEEFFKSQIFYDRITSYNFNLKIAEDKTYAKYYNEKMQNIADSFQNILAKYASKLNYDDIRLLEHFGGRAYFFTVFVVMRFLTETRFTISTERQPNQNVRPFINNFKDINKNNFDKHFKKLIELINSYNDVAENEYEKWTIKNINELHTIASANADSSINW